MPGWFVANCRAFVFGLVILGFAVLLPLLAIVSSDEASAGWRLVGLGAGLVIVPVPLLMVALAVRRLLRLDRLRPGRCRYSDEPAVVIRYPMAVALGRLVLGLGLLTGAGGMVAVAVIPVVRGHADRTLVLLLPAVMVYVLFGPGRLARLLTGRTCRGGVWLTPTGLVHRGWDTGLAVRWDDLASVSASAYQDAVIEPRAGAAGWIDFPPGRPGDDERPARIPAGVFGERVRREIADLATEMIRDPAARVGAPGGG